MNKGEEDIENMEENIRFEEVSSNFRGVGGIGCWLVFLSVERV